MLTIIVSVILFAIIVGASLYFSGKQRYDEITGKSKDELGKDD